MVLSACAVSHSGAEFSGIWEGTVEERGKVHRFELRLEVGAKEDVAGHLRLLSEGGPDVKRGMSFDVRDAVFRDKHIKFLVPLTGELESADTLVFELELDGNHLVGTGRERREGSANLPVTLVRK